MESKQSSIIKMLIISLIILNLSLVHGTNLTEYHPTNRRVAHW